MHARGVSEKGAEGRGVGVGGDEMKKKKDVWLSFHIGTVLGLLWEHVAVADPLSVYISIHNAAVLGGKLSY